MASTLSTDLYIPEVWADLAHTEFKGKVVVGNYAVQDDTLVGKPGETVTFPKWLNLTEMQDVAETESLVPEKLTQSSSEATIKEAGKAVEFTDKAKLTGIGNVQDEAIRQFGVLSARKVDLDLIGAATEVITDGISRADGGAATDSKPFTYATPAGGLTYASVVAAAGVFGDTFDPADFAALIIRSDAWGKLAVDDQFINAAQMQGANLLVNKGQVGQILGLDVVVSDRLAAGKALLLKKGALGVLWKRRPIVEQDRDILARSTVVATNQHYAVKRLNDEGVVDITVTA